MQSMKRVAVPEDSIKQNLLGIRRMKNEQESKELSS